MQTKQAMKKLFGTDGMRGVAGEFPLDAETIYQFGKSLARQLKETNNIERPNIVIGRDTRESGAWIENAFCEGAKSENAVCLSANIITTPGVAFLTRDLQADAGVVVSASHNPFHDNGLKIFLPSGKKVDEKIERQIEADIYANRKPESDKSDFDFATPKISEFSAGLSELQNRYLTYLKGEFSGLSLIGLKIVLDCANGASFAFAPKLFAEFGAEVIAVSCEPNGTNINEKCGSLHLEKLQAIVLAEKADFGAAFDGDADRALFVNEKGEIVDGDATLWVMANHLKAHGKLENSTVVATVMSNIGLELALKSKGIKLLRADVGDKYVLQGLLETASEIGGEQSGHIIFPNRSLVGDGMMTALGLLEAMGEQKKSLTELVEGFMKFPQILVNVKVREKFPFTEVPEIAEAAEKLEQEVEGQGRLLLRYSGTENLARVMIEGENQSVIETQANDLADVIRQTIGI